MVFGGERPDAARAGTGQRTVAGHGRRPGRGLHPRQDEGWTAAPRSWPADGRGHRGVRPGCRHGPASVAGSLKCPPLARAGDIFVCGDKSLTRVAVELFIAGTSGGTDLDTIMSSGPQVISGMPQALQSLASPQALDSVASTATDSSASSTSATSIMNELSTPLKLASMPMSMLSKLFTAGSTATAAKAATTAANELGAANAVGLTSSNGALGSAGIGAVGSGAPALSAGMGRATSVGALTVPSAWTGAAPPVTAAGTAMHVGGTPAISAAPAGTQSAMPPMMPIANMGGRGGAEAPTRFELRSTVIPFTPAAG